MADLKLNVVIGGVQQSVSTLGEVEQALRDTRAELEGVAIGSQAFQDLTRQARTLQGQLEQVEKAINFEQSINLLGESVGRLGATVASGFAVATSAVSLFFGESEELTEAQIKAQQTLNLVLGATTIATNLSRVGQDLKNVSDALGLNLTRQKVATTITSTVATEAQAVATTSAAAAQTSLNVAMAANPIGLVLAGITALVGALILFSDEEETAKSSIKETTDALLEQADAERKRFTDLQKVVELRRELYVLDAKNEEERAKRQREVNADNLKDNLESLDKQIKSAENANKRQLEEFDKYKKAYTRERQDLVRSVAEFDEFGVYIGQAEEYRTVVESIGQDVLDSLGKQRDKRAQLIDSQYTSELQKLQNNLNSGLTSQKDFERESEALLEETNLKKIQSESKYYIDYLTNQQRFLKSSSQSEDETLKENLANAIESLKKTRTQYEQYYAERIRLLLDTAKKEKEEEEKEAKRKEEEAKRAAEKARQDRKKALDDNQKFLDDQKKAEIQNQIDLNRLRIEQETITLEEREKLGIQNLGIQQSLLKLEFDLEVQAINDALAERNKEVQQTKALSKSKRDALIKDNKDAAEAQINSLRELFNENNIIAQEEDQLTITQAQERTAKLAEINRILQSEIRFGDQDTFDNFEALQIRRDELEAERLGRYVERQLAQEGVTLQEFEKSINEREKLLLSSLNRREQIELRSLEAENRRNLVALAEQLESEFELQTDFDTRVLAQVLAFTEEQAKIERDALLAREATLTDEERAYLALLQTRVNQTEETAIKTTEITQQYADQRVQIENEADDRILEKRLQTFNDIFNNLKAATAVLRTDVTEPYFATLDTLQQGIDDFLTIQDTEFATTFQKIAAYAGAALQLVQSVLSTISQANQQALEQELAEYDRVKNEETDILTRQLNQGLITRQQYDAAIDKLDKDLQKKALAAKKKAFEEDKNLKIAQAIIAGLQGAVSAFAGAMQLGPVAGPIVGGILAAAVAALTGVQVAAIKKQKFDAGGVTESINPPTIEDPGAQLQQQAGSSGGFTQFNEGLTGTPPGGGTDMTGGQTGGMRVYVLESDITATQRRVEVAETTATFG